MCDQSKTITTSLLFQLELKDEDWIDSLFVAKMSTGSKNWPQTSAEEFIPAVLWKLDFENPLSVMFISTFVVLSLWTLRRKKY